MKGATSELDWIEFEQKLSEFQIDLKLAEDL